MLYIPTSFAKNTKILTAHNDTINVIILSNSVIYIPNFVTLPFTIIASSPQPRNNEFYIHLGSSRNAT
jgi:hypothetical protein